MNNDQTPDTVTVQLPGTPPAGHEFVAAFTTPIALDAMGDFCRAIAACYGDDAQLMPSEPGSPWVAVTARIDRNKRPKTDGCRDYRVSTKPEIDEDDGALISCQKSPEAAVASARAAFDSIRQAPACWVWLDGQDPATAQKITRN